MIINADAIQWAKEYEGDLFHALICDPPYHLTTITDRFGKNGSAPAKEGTDGAFKRLSTGFMGKVWDGGDIAFQPETWESFLNILYPGAFGMAFGGSRTAHRMAVAIEDAGFIIHPQMSWIYGSGFPKATRIKDTEIFEGHRYGLQALKPASEPIIVFQKPYEGRPVDCITETGAGALWLAGGRIGAEQLESAVSGDTALMGGLSGNDDRGGHITPERTGRWPANFVLTHSPDCEMAGYRDSDSYQINRFTAGAKPFGDGAGHEFESEEVEGGRVPVWECVEGCPANSLGDEAKFFHQSHWAIESADPFVYQAKVSVSERNAGLKAMLNSGEYVIIELTYNYKAGDKQWQKQALKVKLQVDMERSQKKVIAVSDAKPLSSTEWSTVLFGNSTMAQSLMASKCIISMEINLITESKISNWLHQRFTKEFIAGVNYGGKSGGNPVRCAENSNQLIVKIGISQKRDGRNLTDVKNATSKSLLSKNVNVDLEEKQLLEEATLRVRNPHPT